MDIRKYIKIKTVAGGLPTQSAFISGVVFTKNTTHKKMRRDILFAIIPVVEFDVLLLDLFTCIILFTGYLVSIIQSS
jgi:hypothetical protein